MAKTRLFYAPEGKRPREITGRVFKHPETGLQIHNPTANPELDILPLEAEVAPPDSRTHNLSDRYTRGRNSDVVRMTWSSSKKPAAPALPARIEQLRQKAMEVGNQTSLGFTKEALDIAQTYKASGGTGPWVLHKADGTWVELNAAELTNLVDAYATRMNEVMKTARTHSKQLRTHVAGDDIENLLAHDLNVGWPA